MTPADRDAEMGILAGCLTSRLARDEARATVTAGDFYWTEHQAVFDAMRRLDQHRKPVDAITVAAVVAKDRVAAALMPELVTHPTVAESVGYYAAIVHGWGVKRRLYDEATRVHQQALSPDANATGLAAGIVNRFTAIRDAGATEDIAAVTLSELMGQPDKGYEWVIPGLLERGDRLILTGMEGAGKSLILRQIVVLAAAGLHPFDGRRIDPIKAVIYDSENTDRQIKRKVTSLHTYACQHGTDPGPRVMIDCPGRIDLSRDRDLARIHQLLDAMQPDVLVIGPLYRLLPRAIQTDDEAAPLLTALDTIRDRGIALLIEAHAGHTISKGGERDMRPRGSSALMGWPEFGLGLRTTANEGLRDLVAWRGARDERSWPTKLAMGSHMTWNSIDDRWDVPA